MKLKIKAGATSRRIGIFIADSSSATGAGLTGLTNASAGLVAYYWREDQANVAATAIALAAGTRGTWSAGGFVEKDAANMPGWYELGLPDAVLATGAKWVALMLKGATNMAPLPIEIQLVAYDPDDAAALGLSRVDAAVSTRMATFALPANFSVLSISAAGLVDQLQSSADKVWNSTTRALTDKVGFALSAAGVQAIWDALTTALTTVGSVGKRLADNIDATVSSVAARLPAALVGGRIDASVGAMAAGVITTAAHAVGAIDATVLASSAEQAIADKVMATAVDGTITQKQMMQLLGAALAGKLTGGGTTTITIRDVNDTRNCIVATVDANGNRSALTYLLV